MFQVVHEEFGIAEGLMTTVHATTGSHTQHMHSHVYVLIFTTKITHAFGHVLQLRVFAFFTLSNTEDC